MRRVVRDQRQHVKITEHHGKLMNLINEGSAIISEHPLKIREHLRTAIENTRIQAAR